MTYIKEGVAHKLSPASASKNGYQYFGDLHKRNDIQTITHIESNGGVVGEAVDMTNKNLVGVYIPLWPKQTLDNERT